MCSSTAGHWDSGSLALTLSLRRCRATPYTSSAVPRFTPTASSRDMLLSPRPFGSRLVVHLGVLYPELRPPLVAILSVRDTAHPFNAHGSPVFPWLCLPSIANSIFGSCTMCSSYTLDNRKACWPSPCTRLSRVPWTGRYSCRLLRQLRCPSDFQALSAIPFSGAQTGAIPV